MQAILVVFGKAKLSSCGERVLLVVQVLNRCVEQMQKMPTMTSGLVNAQPLPTNSSALRSSAQRMPNSSLSAAG